MKLSDENKALILALAVTVIMIGLIRWVVSYGRELRERGSQSSQSTPK